MPDNTYNESKKNASTSIRSYIRSHNTPVSVRLLYLMALEQYGFGSTWVDNYVRGLEERGDIRLFLDDKGKIVSVERKG